MAFDRVLKVQPTTQLSWVLGHDFALDDSSRYAAENGF